jgi:hypothetical protein
MSVEENKKIHQRFIDDVWMGKNLDSIDEVIGGTLTDDWGKAKPATLDELKEWLGSRKSNIVRTDIHERFGEGDSLAVWKTQYFDDGRSEEWLTLWKFENGKITSFKAFPGAKKDGE